MKRTFFLLPLAALAACGGRTMLADDTDLDGGIVGVDSGPIQKDSGPIQLDSGPTPPPDASPPPPPPVDAGPPPPPPGPIACGNATCTAGAQVCCVTFSGQTLTETCTAQGQCKGAPFECSSAESCPPNEVCCAQLSQTNQSSQCQPKCQGGFQNPQLCANSSECPKGMTCKASPFGFDVCRP